MKPGWFRLGVALAAALPCVTPAFEWSGRAGMLYSRDETYTPQSGGSTVPRLDLDLSLDGAGYVFAPDALTWGAGFGFRRFTSSPSKEPSSSQNRFDYRLRTTAFARRDSPLTLSGFATRSDGDGTGSSGSFGTFEQTYGGNMAIRLLNRPSLELGYSHSDGTFTSPTQPRHESDRDAFTAATSHSTSAYAYTIGYRGNFSSGTYAAENYGDHRIDVNTRVNVFKDVRLHLGDAYYRREPTSGSPYNPRQELNTFSSLVRHQTGESASSEQLRYLHTSALSENTGFQLARSADSLDLDLRRPLAAEWSLLTTLSVNYQDSTATYADQAVADLRARSAGQALTATVYWNRNVEDVATQVYGGPTLGLVEPFDGTTRLGYGASGGASVRRQFQRLLAGAQYAASYTSAAGTLSTSFSQSISATAEGPVGRGRLRASASGAGERTHAPVTGDSASRSLRLNVEFGARSYSTFVEALVRDGVAFPLRDPFRGDGLFLSPGYDARSRSVTGGLRGAAAGLLATASLRVSNTAMPDRPDVDELEARGELSYRIGAFGISFEDRYLLGLRDRTRANVLFFRVYRLLGSRF